MALSTSTSGDIASQSNTQSPQVSAGSGSAPTAAAKSVQPGTATSLLSGVSGGSQGIPLSNTVLPVASLNTAAQTTASITKPTVASKPHHPNIVLVVIVVALAVLAIVSMWLTHQSAKNTTEY